MAMSDRTINGYELKLTCGGCPEQYDVFLDGQNVGYLRLRHGIFRADHHGEPVCETNLPQGDGVFRGEERGYFLTWAIQALDAHIRSKK